MGIRDFLFGKRGKAAIWYDQGNALARSGDYKGAIACYDKAIAIDLEFDMAWMNKGNALNVMNDHEGGLRCFNSALKVNPMFVLAWYNKGLTLEKMNRHEEAIDSYDRALQLDPQDADVWIAKGVSLSRLNLYKESIEYFDKAMAINPKDVLTLFNKGVSLNGLGCEEEAIKFYDSCLKINPKYIEAWCNKGTTLYELNRFQEAIQCFDEALKINPQYSDAWNNKGNSLMELGLVKEAGKCYVTAIKFKPDNPQTHFNLASHYKNSGMHEEAIKEYTEAIRLKPDYARAYLDLGYVHLLKNEFEEAQYCFDSAVKYKPDWTSNINEILQKKEGETKGSKLSKHTELGLKAFMGKDYYNAIVEFEKALNSNPNYDELFYIYWWMGGSLRRINRIDEAEESLKNALNYSSDGKTNKEIAKIYNDLAITLEKKRLYDDAIKALDEAIKLNSDYIRAYIFRSNLYFITKDYNKAFQDAEKVLTLATDINSIEDIISSFEVPTDAVSLSKNYVSDANTMMGLICWQKKEFNKAKEYLQEAVKNNPHNSRAKETIEFLNKGSDFSECERIKISEIKTENENVRKHSISPELHKDDPTYSRTLWEKYDQLLTKGHTLQQSGKYEEATRNFNLAKNQLPNTGAECEIAQCDNYISLILMQQGKYEEALHINKTVLNLYKEIGSRTGEAATLTNQGLILNYYGKYSNAIEICNKAINFCQKVHYDKVISKNLGNMGISYEHLGDLNRAIECHLEALSIDIKQNYIEDAIKDKGNLASCYFELMLKSENDTEFDKYRKQAESYQNDIVDYYKRTHIDSFMKLRAVTSLVNIHAEVGRWNRDKKLLEGCLESLDEAKILSNQLKDLDFLIYIFEIQGKIYRFLAYLEDKREMKINQLNLSEKFLREANSRLFGGADFRHQLGITYQALANFEQDKQYLRLNQSFICYEEAINDLELYRGGVTQQELRMSFVGSRTDIYSDAINFCIDMDKKRILFPMGNSLEKAFEYIERVKSRTFIESLGIAELNPPEELEKEYQHLLTQEKEYLTAIRSIQARQYQIHDESHFILHEQLREHWNGLEKIHDGMENISPEINEYVSLRRGKPLNYEKLKECLEKNIVLVEYFSALERTLIFIIKGGSHKLIMQEVPISQQEIRKLINTNFGERNKFEYLDVDHWQEQCGCLVEPIVNYLNENDIIYFVPHGLLHYIPLHALKVNDKYLIEKHPVVYSPSASVIKYCQTKRQKKRETSLVFGDSLGDLNSAHKEAESIAHLFGSKAYLQKEATLRTFRKEATDKDIIHLSCHGKFRKYQPMESGIKFSDGDLTAREIFNMKLNADIVVLSACESGINEQKPGDELIGLTRALIYAGTPSVLVSLWKVDDEATEFLMKSFYEHFLGRAGRKKVSKVEALQKAQQETIAANSKWEHPYYWSSFVLVGDWL